jgi:DNA repair exonuclease SbcCD ATPase subunit
LSEEIKHLEKCLAETQQKIGTLQQQLRDAKLAINDKFLLEKEIASQESVYREQKKCEILAKNYGKAGKIRQLHLKKFSGFLEEALLCHTYRLLPEHRFQIVVDDGIEIKTSKNGCPAYDVKLMSGGEKGALSIAFLFALDDLLPPDRKTSLKILDEAESNYDKERKIDFTEYMLPELRNRAETIVVISHTEMDDQGVFDRIWKVQDGAVQDISGEVREFE